MANNKKSWKKLRKDRKKKPFLDLFLPMPFILVSWLNLSIVLCATQSRDDLRSAACGGRTCFSELHEICCSKCFNNVPVMETYK